MAESPQKSIRPSRSPSPWEEEAPPRSRSRSRSWPKHRSRSRSRSRSRGRSRSRSPARREVNNPGNTLYVTGLSTRVTERDLEDHFSKEGKVKSLFLVVEPRSRISRGFAFVTMDNVDDANRCIKHLNQSVIEGRYITVERSRRKRPRTPTPGHYLGLKNSRGESRGGDGYRGERGGGGGGGRYRGGGRDDDHGGYRRSPRRSPPPYRGGGGGRDYSPPPRRSSPPHYGGGRSSRRERERERSRSYSPYRSPPPRHYGRGPR